MPASISRFTEMQPFVLDFKSRCDAGRAIPAEVRAFSESDPCVYDFEGRRKAVAPYLTKPVLVGAVAKAVGRITKENEFK